MSTKKRKKHDYAALLKYMHMLDDGYSFYYIHLNYGICVRQLKVLRAKYLLEGASALHRQKNIKADFALKKHNFAAQISLNCPSLNVNITL